MHCLCSVPLLLVVLYEIRFQFQPTCDPTGQLIHNDKYRQGEKKEKFYPQCYKRPMKNCYANMVHK